MMVLSAFDWDGTCRSLAVHSFLASLPIVYSPAMLLPPNPQAAGGFSTEPDPSPAVMTKRYPNKLCYLRWSIHRCGRRMDEWQRW